ncbi:uncharacterized protein LOC129316872 isoform X1 [Prosopis cineraria]|uniref:uncharacterized protein LOC129316872 isoform X1 n=1 Tax=Prosopis cineraria TaxID=364024 RepID=UPI00240FA16E|nr:uncharacterized protein LOC129316872 isoform X1 [Prosopis cineraria]
MHRGLPWLPPPITSQASDDERDDLVMSFADTVFGFFEDDHSSSDSDHSQDDVDEDGTFCTAKFDKSFWDEQHQLLQATLCRTGSFETKIRQATRAALRGLSTSGMKCTCRRQEVTHMGCRSCLQREICYRLLDLGYNCAICKSKWSSSSKIPSGEHNYLEVIDNSNIKREVRVVIELNFPGEFEMARANEEYKRLISRLPEVYVGKVERLQVLVKILCSAAKQCMKEKKMHLGPWRKRKYMQAKWQGTCDKSMSMPPTGYSGRPRRPKASLLTCDLLENIPDFHPTVVGVV